MRPDNRQLEIWKIHSDYCYVLRSIYDDGIVATLEGTDFKVLVYIKMCASFQDGFAYPSYQKIADTCGVQRKTAIKAVGRLETSGLLVKEKRGNIYGYRVVEKLRATSVKEGDESTALLEHYYIPNEAKQRQKDYKQFAKTGKNPNPGNIKISINLNIQNNFIQNNENSTINIAPQQASMETLADIAARDDLPVGAREQALKMLRIAEDPRFKEDMLERFGKMLVDNIHKGMDEEESS